MCLSGRTALRRLLGAYRHRGRRCRRQSSIDTDKKVQTCHQGGVGGGVRASSRSSDVIRYMPAESSLELP